MSCPNTTHISSNNPNLCEKNLICKKYYNYLQTECIDYIPNGYYLNDTNKKTIDKCNIKCKECSLNSTFYGLCLSCNTEENYFQKLNDPLNKYSFVECYNNISGEYYLDIKDNMFKPCFNNNSKNDSFCFQKCEYYYYIDFSNNYHC